MKREVERQTPAAWEDCDGTETTVLMEEMLRRENMELAYRRVVQNGGAPGVDGLTVDELREHCREHWAVIREELLSERYVPRPVRKVEIPKPDGHGTRTLGIPCVLDRMIQQALSQVLTPIFDPGFSDSSYGYRPGRSAHQAVLRMREHVAAGKRWVVDIDLESFFDRVQHDVLMARVGRRVKDKRVLRLIRRFLQAGMMEGGVVSPRREGTPQGSPLSPLLSNILLDELDKELEARGHCFVRYADDCNVYVRSEHAGQRVLASLERFLSKRLRLTVNRKKSGVGRPWRRGFLGYSSTSELRPRLRIASKALARFKAKTRSVLRQGRGRSLHHTCETLGLALRGWMGYYRLVETPSVFERLDGWLRRRMRRLTWRHWKRHGTRLQKLLDLGANPVGEGVAVWRNRGPWAQANSRAMKAALHPGWWTALGLPSLSHEHRRLQATT